MSKDCKISNEGLHSQFLNAAFTKVLTRHVFDKQNFETLIVSVMILCAKLTNISLRVLSVLNTKAKILNTLKHN